MAANEARVTIIFIRPPILIRTMKVSLYLLLTSLLININGPSRYALGHCVALIPLMMMVAEILVHFY